MDVRRKWFGEDGEPDEVFTLTGDEDNLPTGAYESGGDEDICPSEESALTVSGSNGTGFGGLLKPCPNELPRISGCRRKQASDTECIDGGLERL
jgi:hypothetical protein